MSFRPVFAAIALVLFAPVARAAGPAQWAVLIGVEEHDNPTYNLKFPTADVTAVEKVLVDRAGLDPGKQIKKFVGKDPTRAKLVADVPAFLKNVGPKDRVVVFFSGHGVRVGNDTYLVPRDFDAAKAEATGIKASELRTWLGEGCKAETKFLILDCCHAGAADGAKSLDGAKLAEASNVGDVPGALVLAACGPREKSYEWDERGQGVFTYWLCRALEGAAAEGDGRVTFDRVNEYVSARVRATAEARFGRRQSPVRDGAAEGNPTLLALKPEPEAGMCRRLAADLDLDARRAKVKSVGVMEFFRPYGATDEELGRTLVPRYLADQLAAELKKLAGADYAVVGPDAMAGSASARDIGVAEVRRPDKLKLLGTEAKAEAVAFGVMRLVGRDDKRNLPDRLTVECKLVSAATGEEVGKTGGVVALKATRPGDDGGSADLRDSPGGDPYAPPAVEDARQRFGEGHPLKNRDFPFPVEVWAGGKKKEYRTRTVREGEKFREEYFVGARKGEGFEVRVGNRTTNPVLARVFVDGFNTLDQVRGLTDEGRGWILAPRSESNAIKGWYARKPGRLSADGTTPYELKPFVFVDVGDSVAGRNKFTQNVGLITVAVFEKDGRNIGVGEGAPVGVELREEKFVVGPCLAVVNVRYVEDDGKP